MRNKKSDVDSSRDAFSRFQRKVVICFTGYRERYDSIKTELSRIGMTNVEYHFDFPSPFKEVLKSNVRTNSFLKNTGAFSCFLSHYSVIKQTYELGYESLLVMEDDIRFLKDCCKIKEIVTALPEYFDYAQFERAMPFGMKVEEYVSLKDKSRINGYWVSFTNLRGGGCYAVSRRAMAYLISEMEKSLNDGNDFIRSNDYYISRCSGLNRYFCTPSVAVQVQMGKSNSDIVEYWRRNEIDGIDASKYNMDGTLIPIGDSNFLDYIDTALNRKVQNEYDLSIRRIYDAWGKNKPALNIVFDSEEHVDEGKVDASIIWGYNTSTLNTRALSFALRDNAIVYLCEPGFISSGTTWADKNSLGKYRIEHSIMMDCKGQFFDGTRATELEDMINDKELVLNEMQISEAQNLIDKIVTNKISKYNHQPIYTPVIGREGVKKVLVIDQSYGDLSIKRGCASEATFKKMLDDAIAENPDCDIIVKTHPDTIAGKTGKKAGYYSDVVSHDNVYRMTEPINPFSLLGICDKVYVCSSQFGLEGLMAGKEVHTYGMPFYAGWGLTIDDQKCSRRTTKRTLTEIVYIFYTMYTTWVMPEENRICTVEEVIDKMIEYRSEMGISIDTSDEKHICMIENKGECDGW